MRYGAVGEIGWELAIKAWRYSEMMERNDTEFERLALAFPTLKRAEGISPWSPNQLDIWATEKATEPAAIAAAQFLLSLWNRNCRWQCGSFDLFSALEKWDLPHRSVFLESVGRLLA